MIKIIGKTNLSDVHLIPVIDARNYNHYQKDEVKHVIEMLFGYTWQKLTPCKTHSILTANDYENYGEQAEISDYTAAPLKDFDIDIALSNGEKFLARFCPSTLKRPEVRLLCGLIRPSYWFECYLYRKGGSRPFSEILFSIRDGELYANHLYYYSQQDERLFNKKTKKPVEQIKVKTADNCDFEAREILQSCYDAWVLTQWLRIARPTTLRKKPKKKSTKPQSPKKQSSSTSRTEYNDRIAYEPEKPERIAIIDGELVRNYTRYTESWIRRAHKRRLPNGHIVNVKATLCGKKTPEAIKAFEDYLRETEQSTSKPNIPTEVDITYRCHRTKKKSKKKKS